MRLRRLGSECKVFDACKSFRTRWLSSSSRVEQNKSSHLCLWKNEALCITYVDNHTRIPNPLLSAYIASEFSNLSKLVIFEGKSQAAAVGAAAPTGQSNHAEPWPGPAATTYYTMWMDGCCCITTSGAYAADEPSVPVELALSRPNSVIQAQGHTTTTADVRGEGSSSSNADALITGTEVPDD
ncbi:hypothetical protein BT96DRAFT_1000343 [Gymnopus androsaceus JB14]|uniref:Uncharacterized protein n=1 Tax=Gymnopus androsaceus JB14 TaxID=1447944 RepID=A0A6A4H2M4_9AGAR|nr:hypothetical protein BT96DRAFT_1000343 [Gymnopus androsaceus JB14]